MNSDSFERPKPYLFAFDLKNIIAVLLRCVIFAQSKVLILSLLYILKSWCKEAVFVLSEFHNNKPAFTKEYIAFFI